MGGMGGRGVGSTQPTGGGVSSHLVHALLATTGVHYSLPRCTILLAAPRVGIFQVETIDNTCSYRLDVVYLQTVLYNVFA